MWDGSYYALTVTECLGVEDKGGMVRIGAVHYNTVEEVKRLGDALREYHLRVSGRKTPPRRGLEHVPPSY